MGVFCFYEIANSEGIVLKMKKWICYIVSVLLFCGYLVILWLAFHPNVPIEYELFYINREIDFLASKGAFSYELGKGVFPTNRVEDISFQKFAKGFWATSEDGVWTLRK